MQPIFEQLKKYQRLNVMNPDNGRRFTIELKDWRNCVFFIGIIEGGKHITPHYAKSINDIEDYLSRLQLDERS
ncbi:MAG TPA: hypothetical protein VI728_11125 [Syntrophales bacterium]|nr:hypothetical protein [Syntrophales bacterium]